MYVGSLPCANLSLETNYSNPGVIVHFSGAGYSRYSSFEMLIKHCNRGYG